MLAGTHPAVAAAGSGRTPRQPGHHGHRKLSTGGRHARIRRRQAEPLFGMANAPLTDPKQGRNPRQTPSNPKQDRTVRSSRINEVRTTAQTRAQAGARWACNGPSALLELKEEQQTGARVALQQVDASLRQAVLDEWAERAAATTASAIRPGLFGIIQRAIHGEFNAWAKKDAAGSAPANRRTRATTLAPTQSGAARSRQGSTSSGCEIRSPTSEQAVRRRVKWTPMDASRAIPGDSSTDGYDASNRRRQASNHLPQSGVVRGIPACSVRWRSMELSLGIARAVSHVRRGEPPLSPEPRVWLVSVC